MDVNSKGKIKINSKNIAIYKSNMEEIKFLTEHLNDVPDIFGGDPIKCKMFLIKVFTALDGNFYYMSLLSNDAIDQELSKVACILQLYPVDSSKKTSELFQNMNEKDLHKFWMRLFKLCKIHDAELESNSTCDIKLKDMEFNSRFCDIKEAINYFNYDISIINQKKLDETVIDKEINTWNDVLLPSELINENSLFADSQVKLEWENNQDLSNLIKNINYIEKKIDKTSKTQNFSQDNKYKDFFIKFNDAIKEISNFESNMNFNSAKVIHNVLNTTEYSGINWTLYKNQIKRCNDLIESITGKKKCQLNL